MINVNFVENAETPPDMSEEKIEYHIMVFVLVDTVMKELQKIHDMSIYEPMDSSTLTY